MSTVIHADTLTFDQDVLQADVPVLVDFYADWCMPCRMIAPDLERLATQLGERGKIVKVNVDEAGALAQRYGVSSIPALFVFVNGEVVSTLIGMRPYAELERVMEAANAKSR